MNSTAVAQRLGMSRSTLTRYETGGLKLDAELLPRLAEVMRVDPCEFLQPEGTALGARQSVAISQAAPTAEEQRFYDVATAWGALDPQVRGVLVDFVESLVARGYHVVGPTRQRDEPQSASPEHPDEPQTAAPEPA